MANTLNEYQQRVVDEIERNICVISSAASGKAICNSDFVPTPDGMRKVSDIREGDYLFDRLGRPTKVLGVFPQGEKEVYEITFGDGRTARCSDEHIWRVTKSTWSNKNKWKDMTLKEIMSKPLIDNSRGAYFRIPNSHAVEYPKKDYKVNPYIIGAFLGDGCCLEHALTISCGDSEVAEHIAELLGENVTVKKQSESNYSYVFYSNGISIKTKGALPEELITYSYNKHIPIEYKYGSKEQRMELINGLFDTDGSCTIDNRKGHKLCSNVTFSTTSKRLAEDVKEVLGSLGIISDISFDKRTEKYTSGNCFTVYARIPNELKPDFFYIERKKNIARTTENEFQKKSFNTTTIRKIESLGYKEEMTCFYVDNEEHLFLMNDFIVTHNTEVITRRVLNIVNGHGVDPSRILCVSFSKDASVTLNQRFEKNGVKGVNCKTFHALALSIVKLVYPSKQIWTKDYEKVNVIKKICVNNKFCLNQNSVPTGEIMAYITSRQMKVSCQVEMSLDEDTLKEIFDLYNEFKVSKNLIEFNDMVDMAVEILNEKPVVREKYENLYDYIMMDEFQDVSADQYAFAKILGKKANMMVVGDVQQSIYAFRGGLSKFMLSFINDFNAVRMFLPVNYRCNDKIVEMANCLTHVSKDAIANKYIDSIPFRLSNVIPDILTFNNSELEKNFVLNTIKDKKFAYKDNLILARTNRQLYDIFSYLIENNIPCKLIGSLPFYKLSEISTILSYLKFLNNTDNNQAFMAIINKPNRYIPKTLIEGIEECTGYGESMYERMVSGEGIELKYMRNIMELRNFVNKFNLQTFHNVKEIIEYIVEELELNICLTERCSDAEAVNSVLENIDTLKGRCEKYPTIKDFLMAVKKEYEACGKIDDKTDAVILETIHKSKGAEAPRVFVTGFSEGLLPHANAISEEEELHIFYVAVTRARDELHIMHSNNVGIKNLSISRFAKYVEDYIVC